jgi:superfamily II DNA or RNA helicase
MLRNYQLKAKNEVHNEIARKMILQMPTGSGKTVTFIEIAKDHFAETTERILILVHRTELLDQAKKTLGEKCFLINAGVKNIPANYDYYIGMVETVNKRIDKLPKFGLIIIDECHIGNFKKMPYFDTERNEKVLGVTATPIAEQPLSHWYDKLILGPQVSELIEQNHLVNCDVYGFASDLVDKQKWKVKKGEFDEQQMQDFYSSEKMVKNVVNAYWTKSAGKKTIIFNVNVKHNEAVFNAFVAEGLEVKCITGETEKNERKEAIQWFKNNNHAILCNVGVLTTGFDEPSVETIILNRATKSLSLYLQMVGRGSRLSEGKEKFTVLDLGKNTIRHGTYTDYYDWQAYFQHGAKLNDGKTNGGLAPVKECPDCHFLQHTRKLVCVNCGYDFEEEAERQKQEEKEQELILLVSTKPINVPTERIFELAKERGWKEYAVLHKIAEHLANYYDKYKPTVTKDYIHGEMMKELAKWCEVYQKKLAKWNQEIATNILNDKLKVYES